MGWRFLWGRGRRIRYRELGVCRIVEEKNSVLESFWDVSKAGP